MAKKNSEETEPRALQRMPLDELHIDPNNARTHGERNLETIKASLKHFGQQHPIIVGKGGMVIAGNGRLLAMRDLGWTHCDAIISDLDGDAVAAFAIADNRTAELAEWDTGTLADTLVALQAEDDFDHLVIGFNDREIARLLGEGVQPEMHDPGEMGDVEYRVLVVMDTAEAQARLIEQLESEGHTCQPLMS